MNRYSHAPLLLSLLSLTVFLLAGCNDSGKEEPALVSIADAPPVPVSAPAAAPAPATAAAVQPLPQFATATAPSVFKARFKTTKGEFVVEAYRDWAPKGVDRFYNLVKVGFFKDIAFFRVMPGFMVQFGIHGDPQVMAQWRSAQIEDDTVGKASNLRGHVTFAMAGPNTRTSQMFINFGNNARLDASGFPPVGVVVSGMDVVDRIYSGYGGGPNEGGRGPDQGRMQMEGAGYLKPNFPDMDYILEASIE